VDAAMVPLMEWEVVEDDEREVLAKRLAEWAAKYPDVVVQQMLVRDAAAHVLVEESRRAQLMVVGSQGAAPSPARRSSSGRCAARSRPSARGRT